MSRWDYDTVFYRVFCITLLAVAFTFTVILTNVFVDIDGLLSTKDKGKPPKPASTVISHDLSELSRVINVDMLPDKSEDVYDDKDYPDSDDLYRSKRSLETPERIFQIKDPKVKKLLTSHLASLLDALDDQDNKKEKKVSNVNSGNKTDKTKATVNKNKIKDFKKTGLEKDKKKEKEDAVSIKEYLKENKDDSKMKDHINHKDYKAELLHLAMHNVILQGLIENRDLDDVYKKVADLVKDFENEHSQLNKGELKHLFKNLRKYETNMEKSNENTGSDFRNTKKSLIQNDFNPEITMKNLETSTETNTTVEITTAKPKDHNVIVKTIIDITAMSNDKINKENDANAKDKINGIVKLIYNGNVIKFKRMDDDSNINNLSVSNKKDFQATGNSNSNRDSKNSTRTSNNYKTKSNTTSQSYYQKVFNDYLKKLEGSAEQGKLFTNKRLKRHIKIRYDKNRTTAKPKTKKDDDELFVEIETHFDSKGTKGEKKKKLIRDLIQKIQNAIHSDNNAQTHKKKQKHWHVKKRTQDPLSSKSAAALINKLILPLETLAHRQLDPISKTVPLHENMPLVNNVLGREFWEKPFGDPKFFAKSINSAELNIVETDYSKVMRHNGIPQRLQKPLNTDMSDEVFQDTKVVDLGNIKFLMKDIDGSGFSIGFNQYTDEAPDAETMKLFSGLENIIQTYHQKYDQEPTPGPEQQNIYDNTRNISSDDVNDNEEPTDLTENKSEQHVIQKRSILESKENDHHRNNYRIIYGHNILPYKNYNEIFNSGKLKPSKGKNMKVYKMKGARKSFVIDEHIFDKDLKPAEILSIADMLQRKKRSMNVKKISNIKLKTKVSRYLNTKKMATKSIFINKKQPKRSKRQIDKIRIIARDLPQQGKSEEDNIFVVSDEKLFADRALVKEIDIPETELVDKEPSVEHYDAVSPLKEEEPFDTVNQSQKGNEEHEEQFDFISPYVLDVSPFTPQHEFSRRARHNSLMSKYPHIIMEEAPGLVNQGEQFFVDNDQQQFYNMQITSTPSVPTILDIPSPNDQDIAELLAPPKDHSNYRVSVKIRPKNSTNMSGFKEVHTSINKSYNKNGLTYTSLVNVSQLSKVEKLNKTVSRRESDDSDFENKINLKQQQDLIKSLIQQHKHRLDMQLKHLQSEKQKLDNMYIENLENLPENNADKTRPKKIRKADVVKKKFKHSTTNGDIPIQFTTTEPITTTITTTEYIQPTADDIILKTKMIQSIERNENITNQLLKKIDQNTGVLKTFLGKLIEKIDVSSRKSEEISSNNSNPTESSTDNVIIPTNQPNNDRNVNNLPFNIEDYHYMPNMLFRNLPRQANNSYGIPFVYAVQHPYGMMPNRDSIASVVYHGHIHTNTVNENGVLKRDLKTPPIKVVLKDKIKIVTNKKNANTDFWKPMPGEKVLHDFVVNKNNSRFFLDDSHNDFTVVPQSDPAKKLFPVGLVNGTKV